MAKINGLFGRMSGRLGSTVFYGGKGPQAYSRIHIPNPKNPDTIRQRISRELFNMGRSIVSDMAGGGVLAAANVTRQRLLGNIIKNNVVKYNPAGYYETAFNQLQFAIPHSDMPAPNFGQVTADGDLVARITLTDDIAKFAPYMVAGAGLAIVAFAIADGGITPAAGAVMVTDADTKTITLRFMPESSGVEYYFYAAVREVLPSKNGYEMDDNPLMYPAKISEFRYVGRTPIE